MDFYSILLHVSAVYFSHQHVGYWSREREKVEAPVPTNIGYKVIVNIYTQQAKDINLYKVIRKIYIKQTGVTANCV
jgi:hypothetical protein